MKVGSFVPEQLASVLYAMAGDDCSLHHDLDSLTPKQQVDHQENQILTCALQVALTGLGKANDYVALGAPHSARVAQPVDSLQRNVHPDGARICSK